MCSIQAIITVYFIKLNKNPKTKNSQCWGSGMFIPEPNFSTPDPGSKRFRIPDPGSASRNTGISVFNPKKCFSAIGNMISDVHPRIRIPIPGSWFLPIPDPGVKKAPDPVSKTPTSCIGHQIYRNKWNHTRVDVAEVHQGQIQGGQKTVGRHARRVTHVQSHLEIVGQIITALLKVLSSKMDPASKFVIHEGTAVQCLREMTFFWRSR